MLQACNTLDTTTMKRDRNLSIVVQCYPAMTYTVRLVCDGTWCSDTTKVGIQQYVIYGLDRLVASARVFPEVLRPQRVVALHVFVSRVCSETIPARVLRPILPSLPMNFGFPRQDTERHGTQALTVRVDIE